MGHDISLFSGYSQKENRTTNYCLLVLKMLYEENPKFLGEVLTNLIDDDLADVVGVQFRQQTRKASSIPDGLIVQKPLTIYIETKNFNWFYEEQLGRQLDDLANDGVGVKALIALGNFDGAAYDSFEGVRRLCAEKYEGRIYFAAVSFEEFVEALPGRASVDGQAGPRDRLPKNLADTIDDFETYLDEENLLPRWMHRLDVVNCSGRPSEILKDSVYICPAKGGAYNHSRAMYFGMYQQKSVRHLAQIEAVVQVDGDGSATLQWKNVETPVAAMIDLAKEKAARLRPGADAVRVFLLGPLCPTDFRKPTKGGMQTSKRYFDIEKVGAKDAVELAQKLAGKSWKDF